MKMEFSHFFYFLNQLFWLLFLRVVVPKDLSIIVVAQ